MRTALTLSLKTLGAAVCTTLMACAIQSLTTAQALEGMGIAVSLKLQLDMFLFDVIGMGPAFGGIVLIGFLIAFPCAALLRRYLPMPRTLAYPLAGAACLAVALISMRVLLELTPISSARTDLGFWLLIIAGGIGGRVFARLNTMSQQTASS